VACRGWQTPYPQKRQQTLGATLAPLWKSAESREFSGFAHGIRVKKPKYDQFLTRSLNAAVHKAFSVKRTSYPQKRQQRLGASMGLQLIKKRGKTVTYAGYYLI
jgi:hypothetical protein